MLTPLSQARCWLLCCPCSGLCVGSAPPCWPARSQHLDIYNLQYLVSTISISRSASPRACSPASAGSPGPGPSSWTGRWRPTVARHMLCAMLTAGRSGQAGDGSEGVGPHRPLQRRRLRPRHEPQPRYQHPRAARRRGLRLPGVALVLNRFFSVAGLVFAFSKSG